jgi:hypothetical protein
MLKTYAFYLHDGQEPVTFVPMLCSTDVEALRRARALLKDHPEYETIEVLFGDQHVFTIEQSSP